MVLFILILIFISIFYSVCNVIVKMMMVVDVNSEMHFFSFLSTVRIYFRFCYFTFALLSVWLCTELLSYLCVCVQYVLLVPQPMAL